MLNRILESINNYMESCEGKTHISKPEGDDFWDWYSEEIEATRKFINSNYTSSTAKRIRIHQRAED